MCASGRPITLLLFCLFGSAASSPVAIFTSTPPLLSQISPPSSFTTILPSPPSPSLSNFGESKVNAGCPLKISPSALVVRFGDPVTANCSLQSVLFPLLGWEPSQASSYHTFSGFLVWHVDNMTDWSIKPQCYAMSDMEGQCSINLSLTVYKPPDNVSISFVDHSGPMLEGRQYTLQCHVQDVAPVKHLFVTFYKGQTVLGQLQSSNNNTEERSPVNETFTFNITSSKEDDGVQYWCEAKLELGPEGPQRPPVVTSGKLTATVLFGPQLVCPAKLRLREGERLSCEVRGNPKPSVTWFKNGLEVSLPTHPSRMHAGTYTVLAEGRLGRRNFTVEVEVLPGNGSANRYNRHFLLLVLLTQMIIWL